MNLTSSNIKVGDNVRVLFTADMSSAQQKNLAGRDFRVVAVSETQHYLHGTLALKSITIDVDGSNIALSGARFSEAHAQVLSSIMGCEKENGGLVN